MKKLSEIGRRVEPNEYSITQFEPYTMLTDKERRKLVHAVWEKAQYYGHRNKLIEVRHICVDEFIESEGL